MDQGQSAMPIQSGRPSQPSQIEADEKEHPWDIFCKKRSTSCCTEGMLSNANSLQKRIRIVLPWTPSVTGTKLFTEAGKWAQKNKNPTQTKAANHQEKSKTSLKVARKLQRILLGYISNSFNIEAVESNIRNLCQAASRQDNWKNNIYQQNGKKMKVM